MASSKPNAGGKKDSGKEGKQLETHFEGDVLVHSKHQEREEVFQPLTVWVQSTRAAGLGAGPRSVSIRLTDHTDPFFLFAMTLSEDDYGLFKVKHELTVDFNEFPHTVTTLFSKVDSSPTSSDTKCTFTVDSHQVGLLRIVQKSEFRTIELLSVQLVRQGDAGQKAYLAERYQHFEALYKETHEAMTKDVASLQRDNSDLSRDNGALRRDLDESRRAAKTTAVELEAAKVGEIAQLKEAHNLELRQLQQRHAADVGALRAKLDSVAADSTSTSTEKDNQLVDLRQQLAAAHSKETSLAGQLRIASDTNASLERELARMKQENDILSSYRAENSRTVTDQELRIVSMTEKLRYHEASERSKNEQIATLSRQCDNHEASLTQTRHQLQSVEEQLRTTEASLQKSHHVLNAQQQALRVCKEKSQTVTAQLREKEQMVQEKQSSLDRLHAENDGFRDRLDHANNEIAAMKARLRETQERCEGLTNELAETGAALLHIQHKNTTLGVGSRPVWSSSNVGASASNAAPMNAGASKANLYREFAKNLSTGGSGAQGYGANLSTQYPMRSQYMSGMSGHSSAAPSVSGEAHGYAPGADNSFGKDSVGGGATTPSAMHHHHNNSATSNVSGVLSAMASQQVPMKPSLASVPPTKKPTTVPSSYFPTKTE